MAVLTQRGGGRIGSSFWRSVSATWPFVTLEATCDALTMRFVGKSYRIDRASVDHVRPFGPSWAPPGFHGVVISHHDQSIPSHVLFWSFDRGRLLKELRDQGYALDGETRP